MIIRSYSRTGARFFIFIHIGISMYIRTLQDADGTDEKKKEKKERKSRVAYRFRLKDDAADTKWSFPFYQYPRAVLRSTTEHTHRRTESSVMYTTE